MSIIAAIVLGIVGLSFVLYPLYRAALVKVSPQASLAPPMSSISSASTRVNEQTASNASMIGEREQAARNALQEVELDYQLGNISDDDYNTLRERYVYRALRALKSRYEQDKQQGAGHRSDSEDEPNESMDYDSSIDEMIEKELQRLREQGNRGNDASN